MDVGQKILEDDALILGQVLAADVDVAHVRLRSDGSVVHHNCGRRRQADDRDAHGSRHPLYSHGDRGAHLAAAPPARAAPGSASDEPNGRRAGGGSRSPVTLDEAEATQAQAHGLGADVEAVGQAARVGADFEHRLAHEVVGHEQLGGELVGLVLEPRRGLVGRAAALGDGAVLVQQEMTDLVGDREPQPAFAGPAAQLDRVAVAEGHERRLGAERLAPQLDERQIQELTTSRNEMGARVTPAALSMRCASRRMASVEYLTVRTSA